MSDFIILAKIFGKTERYLQPHSNVCRCSIWLVMACFWYCYRTIAKSRLFSYNCLCWFFIEFCFFFCIVWNRLNGNTLSLLVKQLSQKQIIIVCPTQCSYFIFYFMIFFFTKFFRLWIVTLYFCIVMGFCIVLRSLFQPQNTMANWYERLLARIWSIEFCTAWYWHQFVRHDFLWAKQRQKDHRGQAIHTLISVYHLMNFSGEHKTVYDYFFWMKRKKKKMNK